MRSNKSIDTDLRSASFAGDRSPDFDTILEVIGAPGLKSHAEAHHHVW